MDCKKLQEVQILCLEENLCQNSFSIFIFNYFVEIYPASDHGGSRLSNIVQMSQSLPTFFQLLWRNPKMFSDHVTYTVLSLQNVVGLPWALIPVKHACKTSSRGLFRNPNHCYWLLSTQRTKRFNLTTCGYQDPFSKHCDAP